MAEFTDLTRRSLLTATAGLALPVAGCLSGDGDERRPDEGDAEEIEPGGEFAVGIPGELEALNALTASSAQTNALLDLLYQPGVVVEPEGFEAMPWVFTDWDDRETAEGMEVRFGVREDLRWTDGEPLTVEDVRFTYEYYLDRQPGRFFAAIGPIESIREADGEYDLALSLDRVVGTYEVEQLSLRLLPEHVWSDVEDHVAHDPDEPVGLGPGRLAAGSEAELAVDLEGEWPLANQAWIEEHDLLLSGGPYLDSIRVRTFESDAAVHRALLNDEIDAIYASAFDVTEARTIDEREGLGLIEGRDDGYGHYTLNTRVPPLDDQAFRQALSMAMDRRQWVEEIALGYAVPGSVVVPPAFEHLRPETAVGDPVQQRPDEEVPGAIRALWFREAEEGDLDVEAVRAFLERGAVVSGAEGTYAGFEYPGSLTAFGGTAQTEAAYDYAFGEVRSSVLEEAGVDRELYADGRTVEELHDGPLTMLTPPADERPLDVEFTRNYVRTLRRLGIPIETEVLTADSIADRAYLDADFDVYPGDWSALSTAGAPSLYDLFHSDNAHAEGSGSGTFAYNAAGYGLDGSAGADDAIAEARAEADTERRHELVRAVAERIYLEAPTLVRSYSLEQWPVDTAGFAGFLPAIPGAGSSNLWMQSMNVHRR